MNRTRLHGGFIVLLVMIFAAGFHGCGQSNPPQRPGGPFDLLLPKSIKIHPFTSSRTVYKTWSTETIIDVRIQTMDSYEDASKAFGDFRFELYEYSAYAQDHKGAKIAMWEESLLKPRKNALHWDKITRAYKFKLQWDKLLPVGERFVLTAVFSSPYTERLFDEREFVAGP